MATSELPIKGLTDRIIGACIEVHRNLGPGLLENAYELCVVHELTRAGITCERQVSLSLTYKDLTLTDIYRLDIVVDGRVILEVKAVEALLPVHSAQLVTYLRLANKGVGLLVNFHAARVRDQLKRFINPAHEIPRVSS